MLFRVIIGLALVFTLLACGDKTTRALSLAPLQENANIDGFQIADKVIKFEFPRDHGEHPDFQTEWWYVVGIVEDAEGREFGFQFTLFRQALSKDKPATNPWRSNQIYMAHFAIADIQREQHHAFERFSRGHQQLAGVVANPFKIFLEDWTLHSDSSAFSPLTLAVSEHGYAIDLSLSVTKPIVLHGEQGLSHKSPSNASYYYSIPRLQAAGTLTTPERSFKVKGQAWVDREWSTGLLNADYKGWNWLTLLLDDEQDLILFNLVPKSSEVELMPVGLLVAPDGTYRQLSDAEWKLTPRRHWREWPVEWDLEFGERSFVVNAAFDGQLMSTSIRYWEGVVRVTEGSQSVGKGYLELTGY